MLMVPAVEATLFHQSDRSRYLLSLINFQKDLPNDTLVILKNSGHVPMEEDPEESLEVVLPFIAY